MNNQKILVAGLGSTGVSILRYLAHIGASQVIAYDEKLTAARQAELAAQFPRYPTFSGSLKTALADRTMLILSPGISRRQPEIREFEQRGGVVTGDVAILSDLLRHQRDCILAITGSNGKTTTTSLVGHLCQQSGLDTIVAGNIGTPVLDAWLQRQGKSADVWVLELSSFQLETTPCLAAAAAA